MRSGFTLLSLWYLYVCAAFAAKRYRGRCRGRYGGKTYPRRAVRLAVFLFVCCDWLDLCLASAALVFARLACSLNLTSLLAFVCCDLEQCWRCTAVAKAMVYSKAVATRLLLQLATWRQAQLLSTLRGDTADDTASPCRRHMAMPGPPETQMTPASPLRETLLPPSRPPHCLHVIQEVCLTIAEFCKIDCLCHALVHFCVKSQTRIGYCDHQSSL